MAALMATILRFPCEGLTADLRLGRDHLRVVLALALVVLAGLVRLVAAELAGLVVHGALVVLLGRVDLVLHERLLLTGALLAPVNAGSGTEGGKTRAC